MRRTSCLFLIVLLFSLQYSMAQKNISKWSVVPRIGINSSNVSNKTSSLHVEYPTPHNIYGPTVRKVGLTAGVDVDYRYLQRLSTSVGMFYSDEGYKQSVVWTDAMSMKYLSLGLHENFYPVDWLALKAGLQAAYMLDFGYDDYIGRKPDKWNLSLPVGLSLEYWNIVLDFRYNIGLVDIGGGKFDDGKKCLTNSLWLTIGYRINLQKNKWK